MVVRWWVVVVFVVVAIAVLRYRQRNARSAPVERNAPGAPVERDAQGAPVERDGDGAPAQHAAVEGPPTKPAPRFQWGDAVDVSDDSLGPARLGTRGLVLEVIDPEVPTYRVEFADGSSEIVHGTSLAPAERAAG
jgi:hypothetical protein